MAKYIVETYYNCSFKVSHYLDEVSDKELSALEKRDDGNFEILDVKLDKRKTKSLEQKNNILKNENIKKLDISDQFQKTIIKNNPVNQDNNSINHHNKDNILGSGSTVLVASGVYLKAAFSPHTFRAKRSSEVLWQ